MTAIRTEKGDLSLVITLETVQEGEQGRVWGMGEQVAEMKLRELGCRQRANWLVRSRSG
jgi:hypothetical protein